MIREAHSREWTAGARAAYEDVVKHAEKHHKQMSDLMVQKRIGFEAPAVGAALACYEHEVTFAKRRLTQLNHEGFPTTGAVGTGIEDALHSIFGHDVTIERLDLDELMQQEIDDNGGGVAAPILTQGKAPFSFIPANQMPLFQHKNGDFYMVDNISRVEQEPRMGIVNYISCKDGTIWNRPIVDFFDGRFSPVNSGASQCVRMIEEWLDDNRG